MNVKKLFAGLTGLAVVFSSFATVAVVPGVQAQSPAEDPEFLMALEWAYDNGLTMYNSADAFRPYDYITREQLSKFVSAFGVTNLCLEADVSAACSFSDIPADPTLDEYVVLACQLGLVKGFDGMFAPTANAKKNEMITILMRAKAAAMGEEAPDESGTPWWSDAFDKARAEGITKETDPYAVDRPLTRYEALLMLYRAKMDDADCGEVDLSDLLEDLFSDDDADVDDDMGDDDMDDDDDTGTVPSSDGTLEVSLAPTTPNGASVPGNANVNVAEFDLCAEGDDILVSNIILTRYGIGSDDVVEEVSLFVKGKGRLTNTKSFNSDDEAQLSLKPRLPVESGECETIQVVASVGPSGSVSNEEFIIGIAGPEHVITNGLTDGDFPVKANEFEVAGVDAPTVTVQPDGTVSNVELGDRGVEIADFEIENTSNDGDVFLTSLTMTDGENNIDRAMENFSLECNGILLDEVPSSNDELLSFNFDESPLEVREGETIDCQVFADVTGEAGEAVALFVDEELDVWGFDDQFGVGLDVDVSNYMEGDAQVVDIVAGEVTIVELNLDIDEIKENDEDVILGDFKIIVNAGQDLFIEDIAFGLMSQTNPSNVDLDTIFENFELFDVTNNTRYDLDVQTPACTDCVLEEDNIDIFLPNGGEVQMQVRADTVTTFPANVAGQVAVRLELDSDPSNNDLVIKEDDDDERLTDLTPSFVAFDTIELVDSSIEVNGINLTDVEVVVGAENVDVVMFEVETDDVSPAFISNFTFGFNGDGNSDNISAVRLWKKVSGGWELVEEQGGFEISGGSIDFDDFDEIEIPVSSTQIFLLTVDIVDDESLAGNSFDGFVDDLEADDDDNDDLTVVGLNADSDRTVTIAGAGSLSISADNSDSETDRPRHALGGVESEFVASFEITANDEGIEIEDAVLLITGDVTNFTDAVLEVVFYDDDKTTELYRETISSTLGTFTGYSGTVLNNINLDIPEGSTNIYVTIIPDEIGDNRNGTQTSDMQFGLFVRTTDAEGTDSGKDLSSNVLSTFSRAFDVIPVHVSNLEISEEDENGTTIVDGELNSTTEKLAVVNITANSWDNTAPDGSEAELELHTLSLNVSTSNLSGVDANDFRLRRLNDSSDSAITGSGFVGNVLTFDLVGGFTNDNLLDSGEEVSYVVEFNNVAFSLTDGSVSVEFDEGDGSQLVYADSTLGIGAGQCDADYNCMAITELRFDGTFLGSVSVADNN